MNNLMKYIFAAFIVLGFVTACTSSKNPYAATNEIYKKNLKAQLATIESMPKDSLLSDSLKLAPYWVGTTNFGLRKPSFVIIHHTAQDSCEQTLRTFTLERTQVSAHYVI